MPGPGSYAYDNYSIASSPSRAPRYFQPSQNSGGRFDSPRNSIASMAQTVPDKPQKPLKVIKKPMKSSLSVKKDKVERKTKLVQGK